MNRNSGFSGKTIALVSGAALVALLGLSVFVGYNSTQKEGVRQEQLIVAQYNVSKETLSNQIATTLEQANIAEAQAAQLRSVLEAYVSGRAPQDRSALVNAVAEAAPNVGNLGLYEKVADRAFSGRQAYLAERKKLQDMAQSYSAWLRSGVFRQMFVSMNGFPSDSFCIEPDGQNEICGSDALKTARKPVVVQKANEAYGTGLDTPTLPFQKR